MSYVVVDVESDGPIQGLHSLVCIGAVIIDKDLKLNKTFYAQLKPISEKFEPEALAISGFSREEHESFPDPKISMLAFAEWLEVNCKGKPILLSDNNGYDASWTNWYFHTYVGRNPFGWTSRRIGDMYSGFMNDPYYSWRKHRIQSNTHHPVDDAKGNAEAVIHLQSLGYKIKFK